MGSDASRQGALRASSDRCPRKCAVWCIVSMVSPRNFPRLRQSMNEIGPLDQVEGKSDFAGRAATARAERICRGSGRTSNGAFSAQGGNEAAFDTPTHQCPHASKRCVGAASISQGQRDNDRRARRRGQVFAGVEKEFADGVRPRKGRPHSRAQAAARADAPAPAVGVGTASSGPPRLDCSGAGQRPS